MSEPRFTLPPRRLDTSHQVLGYLCIAGIILICIGIGVH